MPHSLSGISTSQTNTQSVQHPKAKRNLILQCCAGKIQRLSSPPSTSSRADQSPATTGSTLPASLATAEIMDGKVQAGAQCPWMVKPGNGHRFDQI